jgi:hypothetical protein
MMPVNYIKFLFIALCFATALACLRLAACKKDGLYLTAALFFTLAADYCLLLTHHEVAGIRLFVLAHAAYILRAGVNGKAVAAALACGALGWLVLPFDALVCASVVYAAFFVWNLAANIKKPRCIILAGLILFALCDACVLVYNLPRFWPEAQPAANEAYKLIWWFYAPSQGLLAVSGLGRGWRARQ